MLFVYVSGNKYGVETKTLALDFGQATEESYEKVKSFLRELVIIRALESS